jgi:hypothetical protein
MKKFLILAAFSILALSTYAQRGVNYLGLAFEAGIPTGDFSEAVNVGIGGSLKLLMGVGSSPDGQISFTTGYNSFAIKPQLLGGSGINASYFIIPILLGYRHNFNGLFLEPKLGAAIYGLRASAMGQSDSDSDAGFTWAMCAGFASKKGFELGVRYQSGKLSDGDSPFSLVGIHIGYNLSLKKK